MDDNIINYMLKKGRSPTFDGRGNVRGFSSRPGAPQADQSNWRQQTYGPNLGSLTPKSNWESMFHNSISGINTVLGPAGSGQPPSLATIAGGGVTPHQQRWMQPTAPAPGMTPNPLAGTGYETGDPNAILAKYATPGSPLNAGLNWNMAFQDPQKQDEED